MFIESLYCPVGKWSFVTIDFDNLNGWQPQAKLGDGFWNNTIPKASGFEAATQLCIDNPRMLAL